MNVPGTLGSCPDCGGELAQGRVDPSATLRTGFTFVTDLPPLPRPRVTQYRVWACRCIDRGRKVRGEHPGLAPGQYGATTQRLGPQGMDTAHALHYRVGIPVRQVPAVLDLLTGLDLTQGPLP
jgi:hypothetical protein